MKDGGRYWDRTSDLHDVNVEEGLRKCEELQALTESPHERGTNMGTNVSETGTNEDTASHDTSIPQAPTAPQEDTLTDPLVNAVAAMLQTLSPEQRATLAKVLIPKDDTGD